MFGFQATKLPPLRKEIIYLDQNAFSNIAATLNSHSGLSKKIDPAKYKRICELLDNLVQSQIVLCPISEIHERETVVAPPPRSANIAAVQGILSNRARFRSVEDIEILQIKYGFDRYMAGLPVVNPWKARERPSALTNKHLLGWMEIKDTIYPYRQYSSKELEDIRTIRGETLLELYEVFSRQRKEKDEKGLKIQHWQEQETLTARKLLAQMYKDTFLSVPRIIDFSERHIKILNALCWKEGHPQQAEEVLPDLLGFFDTEEFIDLPYISLFSAMFAAIGHKLTYNSGKDPHKSPMNDVNSISIYSPYCDAMFVDNEMYYLIHGHPTTRALFQKYGTRFYCTNTIDEFLNYLNDLSKKIDINHKKWLTQVYGTSRFQTRTNLLIGVKDERATHF